MRRPFFSLIVLSVCVAMFPWGTVNAQDRGPSAEKRRAQAAASEAKERERVADPAVRAAKLAELEAFLRRLVGRFRYDGEVKLIWGITGTVDPAHGCDGKGCYVTKGAQGVADCVGFGNGPGVQCLTHVPWPRFFMPVSMPRDPGEIRWRGPYLDGAMSLFGIDPDQPGVRFLLVDSQSIAFTELGVLEGNTLTFETECPPPSQHMRILGYGAGRCLRTFRIHSLAEGRIEMYYDLKYGPELHAQYRFVLHREPIPPPEETSE